VKLNIFEFFVERDLPFGPMVGEEKSWYSSGEYVVLAAFNWLNTSAPEFSNLNVHTHSC
jgi:hypothetical protein